MGHTAAHLIHLNCTDEEVFLVIMINYVYGKTIQNGKFSMALLDARIHTVI